MSAQRVGSAPGEVPGTTVFKFTQPVAIPSYLIALAIGDLGGKVVGPRSTVWAEPAVLEAAANEVRSEIRVG